ncbi:hypothetical protein ACWKTG_29385, partial [Bacillus thuringiensis]
MNSTISISKIYRFIAQALEFLQQNHKNDVIIFGNYSASSRRLFKFTSLICTFCVNTRYIIQGGGIYVEKTRNS